MYLLAPLILIATSALGAATCHWMGRPVYGPELSIIAAIGLLATELALVTLRAGQKGDQATASQAGLAAMMLLMLAMVGLLVAARFMNVVSTQAVTQWSPLLFLAALALVAASAIRMIRKAPAVATGTGHSGNASKTGTEHV